MVDLLDYFLNLLKLSGCTERFHEIAMMENWLGDKERKMNSRLATTNHVTDRRKRLKQKLLQIDLIATSLTSIATDNYGVQV
jgi:hypothetical protein